MTDTNRGLHRCSVCGEIVAPRDVRIAVTCGRHAESGGEAWNTPFKLRLARPGEIETIRRIATAFWGHDAPYAFGRFHPVSEQTSIVADAGGAIVGVACFHVDGEDGRLVALVVPPLYQGFGVGGALLSAVRISMAKAGARRLRLSTTNDNLPALQFYQRRGFVLDEVRTGEVARLLADRPGPIPSGIAGIPVRDEIRLVAEV